MRNEDRESAYLESLRDERAKLASGVEGFVHELLKIRPPEDELQIGRSVYAEAYTRYADTEFNGRSFGANDKYIVGREQGRNASIAFVQFPNEELKDYEIYRDMPTRIAVVNGPPLGRIHTYKEAIWTNAARDALHEYRRTGTQEERDKIERIINEAASSAFYRPHALDLYRKPMTMHNIDEVSVIERDIAYLKEALGVLQRMKGTIESGKAIK